MYVYSWYDPIYHKSYSTRLSFSTDENILDLILSSSVHINDPLPPISSSDHLLLVFDVFVPFSKTSDSDSIYPASIQLPTYNWSQANFQGINYLLSTVDRHDIFGFCFDVESIWAQFKSIIYPIIDLNVPKNLIPHNKKNKPRHYPKHIRTLLTRTAAIWRSMKNNKTDQLKSKYAQIVSDSDCKETITKYDIDRESKLLDTNNLGAFYKFVNGKLSNSSGIPPLTDPAGNLLISDYEKANLLNSYFQSVFTTDNGILPNFPSRFPPDSPSYINDIHITTSIISNTLKNSKLILQLALTEYLSSSLTLCPGYDVKLIRCCPGHDG